MICVHVCVWVWVCMTKRERKCERVSSQTLPDVQHPITEIRSKNAQ